ncbi:MAG: hypothetical protein JSR73_03870 [Proteobacteria bacterium]|nr:hypothetical protein [Pseudomonadota bacterium]
MAFDIGRLLPRLSGGPTGAPELTAALGISPPTLSRALTSLQRQGSVLKIGVTRGARYALRRSVPGAGTSWPMYRVDDGGRIHELGQLHALEPRH